MFQKLSKSVGCLIVLTVIGQLISFLRESIFAYYYGTSWQSDACIMASQIPIALFAVVTTSINTVILPIYTTKKENYGQIMADKFLNSFIWSFGTLCLLLIVLSVLFSRQIVCVFAPGFSGELLDLTVRYVKLLFFTIFLSSLINILTVRFTVRKNFLFPQCVALFQNIAIIFMMIAFARSMNTDAFVWGTIIGFLLNAILLVIPSRKVFKGMPEIFEFGKDIQQVLSRVIPVACGIGIAEVNRIVDRAIASGLDSGSITGLNYANKLSVAFPALIVTAVSAVCFQQFSALYAKGLFKERFEELQKYLMALVYIILPISFGVLMLKRDLIIVLFARGEFDFGSINLTTAIFYYYAMGILPIALREILSRYYYSSGDTKTPMINSVIGLVINIFLNVILSKIMGAPGLALATTLSYFIVCLLLFISILKKEKDIEIFAFIKDWIPAVVSSVFMCAFILLCIRIYGGSDPIIVLFEGIVVGSISYFFACYFLAQQQLRIVFSVLFRRL